MKGRPSGFGRVGPTLHAYLFALALARQFQDSELGKVIASSLDFKAQLPHGERVAGGPILMDAPRLFTLQVQRASGGRKTNPGRHIPTLIVQDAQGEIAVTLSLRVFGNGINFFV